MHQCPADQLQIGAAQGRTQESIGRRPAHAITHRELVEPDAFGVRPIEVVGNGQTHFAGRGEIVVPQRVHGVLHV